MKNKALASLVFSMFIFGTIGIFRRFIPLPSGFIAFSRGLIGFLFLLSFVKISKTPFSFKKAEKKVRILFISGLLMGFNWILLFEAYNHTSVAAATLCYYMAPVFVIMASPFLFGEKLGTKKILCVAGAFSGMILVSGITESVPSGIGEIKGLFMGLGAAVLYAAVVIMNKKVSDIPPFEKTAIQLGSSCVLVLPYSLLTEDFSAADFTPEAILLLLAVGILHTGISYLLYFGSIGKLPAQTVALFSYIDPVTAIILSSAILNEKLTFHGIIGAVLILASAAAGEMIKSKKR